MLKLENGEKLNIESTTKAETILALIDWDDFSFKDWRFLHNVACGYMEDGPEKEALVAAMQRNLTFDKAKQEVIRIIGQENFDKFVEPTIKYLADERNLGAHDIVNCLYGGLTSNIVDTCKEDGEMWKMFFTQLAPIENNTTGGLNV